MQDKKMTSVAQRLRHDVVFGKYHPNAWIKLADVQKAYGVSQAQARQVVAELCHCGLLEHRHHFGYRVPAFNAERAAQQAEVRTILEVGCAPLLTARASEDDIAHLRELAQRFEAAIESADRSDLIRMNFEFHRAFYAPCGNPALAGAISEWRERGSVAGQPRWQSVAGIRRSAAEHIAMVQALARRDALELQRLIAQHIEARAPEPVPG